MDVIVHSTVGAQFRELNDRPCNPAPIINSLANAIAQGIVEGKFG
jgi:hypothetical protein